MQDSHETEMPEQRKPPRPNPWQPRFGIAGLLLVTLVFAVVAAAASYLARSYREGGEAGAKFVFLMFILAGPPILLVIVALFRTLLQRYGRRDRRDR
jgi:hypothetical protein